MKKTWKTKLLLTIAALWIMTLCTAMTAMAAAKIRRTEYEGKGKVEVHFRSKVQYKKVKVTVEDTEGNTYKTKVVDQDADELELRVTGLKRDRQYKYTITGVRKKGESKYGSVKGTFYIPKKQHGISLEEAVYDARDGEVDFDFTESVQWKNPRVSIQAGSKEYVKRIAEKDKDGIEVKVKKLKKGQEYSYKIKGIRKKGSSEYVTLTGTFVA